MKKVEVDGTAPDRENGVQFERFIFDLLPAAGPNYLVVETTRDGEFAPLKNRDGADSPETLRQALKAASA